MRSAASTGASGSCRLAAKSLVEPAGMYPMGLSQAYFLQPAITVVLFAVSVLFLVGQSYNPFIYFRF